MADTNVLVAVAITPQGVCGRLLDAAIDGRWQLVASPTLLAELTDVLIREKFRRWLSREEVTRYVADITVLADVQPDPPPGPERETADPDDEYLVALSRTAAIAVLVSGDPHLSDLVHRRPPVLTPAALLDLLTGYPRGQAGTAQRPQTDKTAMDRQPWRGFAPAPSRSNCASRWPPPQATRAASPESPA